MREDFNAILQLVRPGSRVLDVGCGSGELLERLVREKQAEGRGLELEPANVSACLARGLAVVQFFSWFALFAMWIYTTAAVTRVHYGATDTTSAAYAAGADWVGVLFGVYNGVAALAAFTLPVIAKRIGRRATHALMLMLGAAGLFVVFAIRDRTSIVAGSVVALVFVLAKLVP